MTLCNMTRSKVKVAVTSPSKSEFQPFSKAIFSHNYDGGWQVTTDSSVGVQYLKLIGARFLNFVPVFVSRYFEVGSK